MSTLQCPLVHAVKAPKRTWRRITRVSLTVRAIHPLFPTHRLSTSGFPLGNLEDLIRHGLHALRETLQQDKDLTISNTSIGIVGFAGTHEKDVTSEGSFRILEGDVIKPYLESMVPKTHGEPAPATAAVAADAPAGGEGAPPVVADEDVQMAD